MATATASATDVAMLHAHLIELFPLHPPPVSAFAVSLAMGTEPISPFSNSSASVSPTDFGLDDPALFRQDDAENRDNGTEAVIVDVRTCVVRQDRVYVSEAEYLRVQHLQHDCRGCKDPDLTRRDFAIRCAVKKTSVPERAFYFAQKCLSCRERARKSSSSSSNKRPVAVITHARNTSRAKALASSSSRRRSDRRARRGTARSLSHEVLDSEHTESDEE